MKRFKRRVLYALMLAAASGIGACERADQLASVTAPPPTPQFVRVTDVTFFKRGRIESGFTCTAKPFGSTGGHLDFASGSLDVMRDAVKSATNFCARDDDADGSYTVELRAYDSRTGAAVTQFATTVKLTLNLSGVGITDWSNVIVVYRNPNGLLDVMPTTVDPKTGTVTASLTHFSDYSPVHN